MIWLTALLLLAIFAGLGYLKGSIQMAISLLGFFVALLLAMPLASFITPLYIASGVQNLLLLTLLPPISVFIFVSVVFMIVGIFVHYKVKKYFQYKTDEAKQQMWQRLNQRVGASIGLLIGISYSILFGVGIYSVGYLTYQVSTDRDPEWLQFITDTRVAMDENGLAKMAASLDPMPARFYEVADLIGLSHRNPLLENRYRNYPLFLKLSERADIQEIAEDATFHGMLVQQASLADILKHPLGQKAMRNAELFDLLVNQTDLKDLRNYLEKGESPIYEGERILGRWELNGNALINHAKRNTPGIKSRELRELKMRVETSLDGTSFIAHPEKNRIVIQAKSSKPSQTELPFFNIDLADLDFEDMISGRVLRQARELIQQSELDPATSDMLIREMEETERQMQEIQNNPQMLEMARQRFEQMQDSGFMNAPGLEGFQGLANLQSLPNPSSKMDISGEGKWDRKASGHYVLEINGQGNIRALIQKNRLLVKWMGMQLVFSRVY